VSNRSRPSLRLAGVPNVYHVRNDSSSLVATDVQRLNAGCKALPSQPAFQLGAPSSWRSLAFLILPPSLGTFVLERYRLYDLT
jgi:hypothetical protein